MAMPQSYIVRPWLQKPNAQNKDNVGFKANLDYIVSVGFFGAVGRHRDKKKAFIACARGPEVIARTLRKGKAGERFL